MAQGTPNDGSNLDLEVSVVIPVYNDSGRLECCLDALSHQTLNQERFEVVVVDNGSTDAPGEVVARYPFAHSVSEPEPGSYAARNRGIRDSRGPVLAFTDSDCVPEPDWLVEGLRVVEANPTVGAVAGAIELFPQDEAHPTGVELFELMHGFPQERYALSEGFGATANLWIRRAVLEVVGVFDARLRSGGDREWGSRARRAGYEVLYCSRARVRHPARATWSEHHRKMRRTMAGYIQRRTAAGYPLAQFGKDFLLSLLPPMGSIVRTVRDPRLPGIRRKSLYVMAHVGTRYVGAFLRLRCRMGTVNVR